jgi:glycosyltransferase involved in cell wall biosynthesis
MPRSKLRLLGNGVDLERFRPRPESRDEVRSELGVAEGQIAVGLVARLVAEKGVPELIEAAARLGDRYVVLIIGPRDPEKADALPEEMLSEAESAGVPSSG